MLHVLKYVGNFAEEIAISVLFRLRLKKKSYIDFFGFIVFFYVIMFKQIKNMRGIQDTPLPSEQ